MNLPQTYYTHYMHLESVLVNGGFVKKGQMIGRVGKSGGTSTAPHLHFEVITKLEKPIQYFTNRNDVLSHYVNPEQYLIQIHVKSPMNFTHFGYKFLDITSTGAAHSGLDMNRSPEDLGDPVYATEDGVIEFSGYNNGFGNHVIIKHEKIKPKKRMKITEKQRLVWTKRKGESIAEFWIIKQHDEHPKETRHRLTDSIPATVAIFAFNEAYDNVTPEYIDGLAEKDGYNTKATITSHPELFKLE